MIAELVVLTAAAIRPRSSVRMDFCSRRVAAPRHSIWSNGGGDYDYTSANGDLYDQDAPTGEVFIVAAVPEPKTIGFLGLTLLLASRLHRRRPRS